MRVIIVVAVFCAAITGGCASDDASQDVETVVRASVRAENAGNADDFLDLWTDKGLSEYDVGTRAEVKAGKSENFGAEKADLLEFHEIDVEGETASATIDVSPLKQSFVRPVYRLTYKLIRRDDAWLMDGFTFGGSPPPAEGQTVVDVAAKEFAFAVDPASAPGDLAIKLRNVGRQQHELILFQAPKGIDVARAKTALADVHGNELDNVPSGYDAVHLSFAEPEESNDVAIDSPLPAGSYVLACYIPDGGYDEKGALVKPDGTPHIQLGMINVLTVE